MELSVSMHAGSKKDAIKNLDKIKKIDEHNNRKYKNVNNKEIDPTLSSENITLRGSNNITNDVKELYKNEFTEAVCKYNLKQTDERRKVVDYLDKMDRDEKNNIAVEFLYQLGDAETWKGRSLEDKKKTAEIFKKAIDILEAKGIKVANATIHLDETSPHMHVVGVPIIENQKRGLEKQLSQRKVLTREVLKELREETEKVFIEEYKRVYKTNDVTLKKGSEIEEHLSVEDYKNTKKMLEVAKKYGNRKELKEEIEKKVDEVEKAIEELEKDKIEKSKKINDLENENKNLTSELTNLEIKNHSLNTEVKELETSKNTKAKEKDDLEKALDLYQQKIKDYKEQIIKDKENLEKEEEEQKRLEDELKKIEKKVKEIKDEIDKKNKEYNDHLTEKNNLEEKKKKLEEDKKNIENAYNLEKENISKDAEEKRKELLKEKADLEKEKADLENDITNINKFIITQKSIKNEREQEAEDYKKIKEESEKLQKDKKETVDLINSLKEEKSRLENEKDALKDIVQAYLEKQKDYNSILTPALKEITKEEKKKEIIETVKNTIINEYDTINIKLEVKGILDHESRYNKEYKIQVEARKDNKKIDKEILTAEEKENLAYSLASANYSIYSNNFDKMEINYNTGDGKTKVEVLHHYTEKDKIEFEPTRLDNFIILIKEKVTDFKNAIKNSLKQKFGYSDIEKDNYFNREQDKKNNDKKKSDIDY